MDTPQQNHLWALLGQTWGHKFLDQYGPSPNEAWSAALAAISPDQAKGALWKLIRAGSPFPPTLPEFMALAQKSRPAEVHPILTHQQPQMSQEQVAKRRAEMQELLRGLR